MLDAALAPRIGAEHDASMGDMAARLDIANAEPWKRYRPLDLVWHGEEDADLIEQLLAFYPHTEPRLILDATVNGRRFWRGSARPVIGLHIDPSHRPEVCADHAAMPFSADSFDVVECCCVKSRITSTNHRYQWAHVDLIRAGQDAGFTACDCIIKVRKGPIIDPKWKVAHHSRRHHSFWIIFRKSDRCE